MNNTKVPSEGSNFSSTLRQLLDIMVQQGASDLHIAVGLPPCLRLDGKLSPIEDMPSLLPNESMGLCFSVLSKEQQQQFERDLEIDFSFGVRGLSRFRASLFQQRGAVSGTFRVIPFRIGTPDELGLPNIVADLAKKPRGLVLITGPTGSGKSTTLACIVNLINHNRHEHIITIEDPIEYLHQHRNCIVTQREIGTDTRTFSDAIRRILRQDPDVIQVGEMRDLASIEATLTLAETGHLVLATLHTSSAINTINRIVDVFPPYKQKQIQIQLSFALEAVICQQLLPRIGGGVVFSQCGHSQSDSRR
jgi:twitching motility protein PilT